MDSCKGSFCWISAGLRLKVIASEGTIGILRGIFTPIVSLILILVLTGTMLPAESSDSEGSGEGIALQRRPENPETRPGGIGRMTKALLAADAATRVLDAYSTERMLRNRCNGDLSVPVCNEEMFLPDFITRSKGTLYGYEGGVWIAQSLAVHRLSKHHPRLARFIPTLDIAATLPFAVNNLRLPPNPRAR